jgi:hypothetical protein
MRSNIACWLYTPNGNANIRIRLKGSWRRLRNWAKLCAFRYVGTARYQIDSIDTEAN